MSDSETSYHAYWSAVAQTAVDVAQRVKDGEDFSDALHEEIDGSWWITYYHAARATMSHTANDDAAFEEMGDDACDGIGSFDGIVTRCAFYAMYADVVSRYEEPEEEEEEEPEAVDTEPKEGPRYDPQPGVWTVVSRAGGEIMTRTAR